MSGTDALWRAENQRYLAAAVDEVRAAVGEHARRQQDGRFPWFHLRPGRRRPAATPAEIAEGMSRPPALERLVTAFSLSDFERRVLLLCAGVELDAQFAALCLRLLPARGGSPTFSLALVALPGPEWDALSPDAPLRYWRLIDVGSGQSLVSSPLRIDEQVLHYLAGVNQLDDRLEGLVELWRPPDDLPPSQRAIADGIRAAWAGDEGPWRSVQLCGPPAAGLRDVAAAACALRGLNLYVIRASDVPAAAPDREALLRLWAREGVFVESALLLAIDGDETPDALRAASSFVERSRGTLIVAGREPLPVTREPLLRFDVPRPGSAEQSALWRRSLGPAAEAMGGQIEEVVNQFDLSRSTILMTGAIVVDALAGRDPDEPDGDRGLLWETCRTQARGHLDDLAQRIDSAASWDDLVLPPLQRGVLEDIVVQVRQRSTVYETWRFAERNARGLGISALFAGPSGTGKTLTAEVLANELRLDLYRIDLSQVVSKYIGETEKNLRRVFDAAEAAGAVLLFDEADALFGRRSEVKDSHDRYANVEISYLLQRMEAYRGLAILTTNMKQALDPAFTRRLRFIVSYEFPSVAERAEIWRRVFPAAAPIERLDIDRLARLNVAGGSIRNIAVGAAFIAAAEGGPVRMDHLLRAARAEYYKLERPLIDADISGWVRAS